MKIENGKCIKYAYELNIKAAANTLTIKYHINRLKPFTDMK